MTKKTVKKKAAPKKKSAKPTAKKEPEANHKVIKTSTGPTISNTSTIKYNLGVDDGGSFFIRILSNSGGGFYSNEWVAMADVTKLLSDIPKDRPITSLYLQPLFKNRSVNTPGFLLAALLNEKVLTRIEGKKRHFAYTCKQPSQPKATKRKRRTT